MSITKAVESPAPNVARNAELKMHAEVFPFAKYFSNKNSHSSSRELRREEIGNETINWQSWTSSWNSNVSPVSVILVILLQNVSSTRLSLKLPCALITFGAPMPALKECWPQSTTMVIGRDQSTNQSDRPHAPKVVSRGWLVLEMPNDFTNQRHVALCSWSFKLSPLACVACKRNHTDRLYESEWVSINDCFKLSPKIRMAELQTFLLRQHTTPNTLNLHDTSISCLVSENIYIWNSQMISELLHMCTAARFHAMMKWSWPIQKVTRWALKRYAICYCTKVGKKVSHKIRFTSCCFYFWTVIRRMDSHFWPASIRFFSAGRFGLWSWRPNVRNSIDTAKLQRKLWWLCDEKNLFDMHWSLCDSMTGKKSSKKVLRFQIENLFSDGFLKKTNKALFGSHSHCTLRVIELLCEALSSATCALDNWRPWYVWSGTVRNIEISY